MARRLEMYIPAKPFQVTQGWDIYNPSYQQFGFTYHNGVDFAVDSDGIVNAPVAGTVIGTGYDAKGAGNFVKYRTDLVNAEGADCYVVLFVMHAREVLVKTGQSVFVGTPLIAADNTGFSTGPHTHITAYRVDSYGNRLDHNRDNDTFDWRPYLNGIYAADVNSTVTRLRLFLRGMGINI